MSDPVVAFPSQEDVPWVDDSLVILPFEREAEDRED